jgi:dihydrofolate reductase
MGKIVISENITLDGVIQDPTGEEGRAFGGWGRLENDRDQEAWAEVLTAEALAAEALLLGRRTYAFFAGRFPSRSGAWADRLNAMPKYVVSATLDAPDWTNTTVLPGDVVKEVTRLRHEVEGDIVLYASGRLARTLMEHDLVDELRLLTYPVVAGAGERLFGESGAPRPLRLLRTRTVGDGLVLLSYRPVRDA